MQVGKVIPQAGWDVRGETRRLMCLLAVEGERAVVLDFTPERKDNRIYRDMAVYFWRAELE